MDLNQLYSDLKSNFPNSEIHQNHPLAPYTTVKIGGSADIFIHTKSSEEFKNVLEKISNLSSKGLLPYAPTILGNGSNVLISDSGLRGIVIKNDSNEMEILPNNQIKVASGVQLPQLINFTLDNNLVGLEEFAYIPSTVGGAIAGNIHGDDKHLFSQFVISVEKINDFIISAIIQLNSGDTLAAKQKFQNIIQKKSVIQSMNSLGSVFKNNPNWDPSGMIIDQKLNLKGYSIGNAQISPLHANFIINNGHATAADYFKLIKFIQTQAQEKLGITLEPEIKFLGEF
ncbi:MAG: FAD-binding protein [Candidatus Shapirobacteria bacterium]|nr:FAD-binding protein [Candidatus Shapirobacteria bacterium]